MKRIWEFISSASQSRTAAFLVILVIGASIPLTVLVAQRQQNFQQKASGPTSVDCSKVGTEYCNGNQWCTTVNAGAGQCLEYCRAPVAPECGLPTGGGGGGGGSGGGGASPSCTLNAAATTVPYSTTTMLNWQSTNAISCKFSISPGGGGAETNGVSGSAPSTAITVPTTFTLTCTGANGTQTVCASPVTVTVAGGGTTCNTYAPDLSTFCGQKLVTTNCSNQAPQQVQQTGTLNCGSQGCNTATNACNGGSTGGILSCAPSQNTAPVNQVIVFTPTNANTTVSTTWSFPGATTPNQTIPGGNGSGVGSAAYPTTGVFYATITNNGQTATCAPPVTVGSTGTGVCTGLPATCGATFIPGYYDTSSPSCIPNWNGLKSVNPSGCYNLALSYYNCTQPANQASNTTLASSVCGTTGGTGNVNFALGLDGIGNAGDRLSSGANSASTKNPSNTNKTFTITLTDLNKNTISSTTALGLYDSSSGLFKGSATLTIPSGTYFIMAQTGGHLRKTVLNTTAGQTTFNLTGNLIAGDVNGDNKIDIFDYKILLGCSVFATSSNNSDCAGHAAESDLNADGKVDQLDYNLLLREFGAGQGD